jgi:hypothetical protein
VLNSQATPRLVCSSSQRVMPYLNSDSAPISCAVDGWGEKGRKQGMSGGGQGKGADGRGGGAGGVVRCVGAYMLCAGTAS